VSRAEEDHDRDHNFFCLILFWRRCRSRRRARRVSVSPVGDGSATRDWAAELVERARSEGVELTGDNGLLTALVRQVLQTGLEPCFEPVGAHSAEPSCAMPRT
jgi:hypothetical protein